MAGISFGLLLRLFPGLPLAEVGVEGERMHGWTKEFRSFRPELAHSDLTLADDWSEGTSARQD